MHTEPAPDSDDPPHPGSPVRHVHRVAALLCVLAAALLAAFPDPNAVHGAGVTLALILPPYVVVITVHRRATDPTTVSTAAAAATIAALVVCFPPILLAVLGLNAAVSALAGGAPPDTGAALALLLTGLALLAASFHRALRPSGPRRPAAPHPRGPRRSRRKPTASGTSSAGTPRPAPYRERSPRSRGPPSPSRACTH
ncbi:hypothetical protein [Nocardiopsis sp. CC223A]|uniref:hypothetical protein n=1 Tax=Nocardiopsis sp. CC223A TaxID=3044051 RepID=UPI00278BB287|nr:hypothetical protein [Nocardiopsis sp. CC223A]